MADYTKPYSYPSYASSIPALASMFQIPQVQPMDYYMQLAAQAQQTGLENQLRDEQLQRQQEDEAFRQGLRDKYPSGAIPSIGDLASAYAQAGRIEEAVKLSQAQRADERKNLDDYFQVAQVAMPGKAASLAELYGIPEDVLSKIDPEKINDKNVRQGGGLFVVDPFGVQSTLIPKAPKEEKEDTTITDIELPDGSTMKGRVPVLSADEIKKMGGKPKEKKSSDPIEDARRLMEAMRSGQYTGGTPAKTETSKKTLSKEERDALIAKLQGKK